MMQFRPDDIVPAVVYNGETIYESESFHAA